MSEISAETNAPLVTKVSLLTREQNTQHAEKVAKVLPQFVTADPNRVAYNRTQLYRPHERARNKQPTHDFFTSNYADEEPPKPVSVFKNDFDEKKDVEVPTFERGRDFASSIQMKCGEPDDVTWRQRRPVNIEALHEQTRTHTKAKSSTDLHSRYPPIFLEESLLHAPRDTLNHQVYKTPDPVWTAANNARPDLRHKSKHNYSFGSDKVAYETSTQLSYGKAPALVPSSEKPVMPRNGQPAMYPVIGYDEDIVKKTDYSTVQKTDYSKPLDDPSLKVDDSFKNDIKCTHFTFGDGKERHFTTIQASNYVRQKSARTNNLPAGKKQTNRSSLTLGHVEDLTEAEIKDMYTSNQKKDYGKGLESDGMQASLRAKANKTLFTTSSVFMGAHTDPSLRQRQTDPSLNQARWNVSDHQLFTAQSQPASMNLFDADRQQPMKTNSQLAYGNVDYKHLIESASQERRHQKDLCKYQRASHLLLGNDVPEYQSTTQSTYIPPDAKKVIRQGPIKKPGLKQGEKDLNLPTIPLEPDVKPDYTFASYYATSYKGLSTVKSDHDATEHKRANVASHTALYYAQDADPNAAHITTQASAFVSPEFMVAQ